MEHPAIPEQNESTSGKLVRDRIPEIIRADGGQPVVQTLDDAAYGRALRYKLGEEAREVITADGGALLDELADVYELVQTIARVAGFTPDDIIRHADEKRAARGGFALRLWLAAATVAAPISAKGTASMSTPVLDCRQHRADTRPEMTASDDRPPQKQSTVRLRGIRDLDATDFAAAGTPDGGRWIAGLEALIAGLAEDWRLGRKTDAVWYGYNAVVMPVERAGEPLVLKVVWPPEPVALEVRALAAWRGRGAVGLVAADEHRGALLLRRLDPARSLADIPLADAASVAGRLIRTLAVAPPEGVPSLEGVALGIAESLPARQRLLGAPIAGRWLRGAVRLAKDLAVARRPALVHADLHYLNVLAGDRHDDSWVAIDPKPFVGDPERSVAELLWTRVDELADANAVAGLLATIVRGGDLDRERAMAWGFVRAIDYWLWGLEHRLTVDPVRCERVASALASHVLAPGR